MVEVSGKKLEVAGLTVTELIEKEDYNPAHVVVELNLSILPREEYDKIKLKDDDVVEIVTFMGGGA